MSARVPGGGDGGPWPRRPEPPRHLRAVPPPECLPADDPVSRRSRAVFMLLIGAARARTILYSGDILEAVPSLSYVFLYQFLQVGMQVDHRGGRPFLSVLTVNRSTGLPCGGFFRAAAELGYYQGPDEGAAAEAYMRAETERVWSYWNAV